MGQRPGRKPAHRLRLDELLVQRGVFPDSKTAQSWIMAGSVIVNEVREDKPGTRIDSDALIRVKGIDLAYASRGGIKLAAALDGFGVDVSGRAAIDAGASTGGFTDCLLKRGAALVYSVDVGFGQLSGRLRQDPRVRNMERTNITDVVPGSLDPRPSLGVIDLSYLSLTTAVPHVANIVGACPDSDIIALVKPLFEVASSVADLSEEHYFAALSRAFGAGVSAGFYPRRVMASPVLGCRGTLEFLVQYVPAPAPPSQRLAEQAEEAVRIGMDLLRRSTQRA